ncbi:MAG: T9SS type A sorting domain-containing protein [Bacteroidia bacterium]|nr:T9SS type A sorting domain-containing protein [Bacteroidia bacterium]
MRASILFASLSLLGQVWAQLSGTYTIGTDGDYPTIDEAFNALMTQGISGSVTFEILPSYSGEDPNTVSSLILNPYPGMETHTVTLTIHPTRTTIAEVSLDPSPISSERFVLRFNGISNFVVDGGPSRLLRFRIGSPDPGVGVIGLIPSSTAPCQNIVLRNLEVDGGNKNSTRVGIYLGSAASLASPAPVGGNNNNLIENCWVYRVQEGIILYGKSATEPDLNNKIRGCKVGHPNLARSWGGQNSYCAGIVTAFQQDLFIEKDTVFNASSDTYYGYTGISVGYPPLASISFPNPAPCVNTHITGNWVHSIEYAGTGGWDAVGIRVHVGQTPNANIYIYNNFIAGILSDGWSGPAGTWNAYGILLDGTSNSNAGVYVYNNSIHLYGTPATSSPPFTSTPSCLAIRSNISGGIYVKNNLFQNTLTPAGAGTSNRTTVAIAYEGSSAAVFAELDNNAYHVSNSNGLQYAFIGALGTNRYTNLSGWATATGREQNSQQYTTPFPFLSATDLHLPMSAAESEVEGGGALITTPITISTDIDGETRPTGTPGALDIGADEMPVPPCPTEITAGSISLAPPSVITGQQAFTVTPNDPVTLPAEWQVSTDGGTSWTTVAIYTGDPLEYTPLQAGPHQFRLVARVARYHASCPGNLTNDTSNVVTGTATCPLTLNPGTISTPTTSQPARTPFTITVTGTVSLPAQWQDSSAAGGWNVLSPYTGSTFTYTPSQPGTYWLRLAALPPTGCSNLSPSYSNVLVLTATATGNTILDPLDITPRIPTRLDTTVNGNNLPPFTDTYTGPGNQNSPDVFYMYVLRECLDSIRVSTCNSTNFGSSNDLYLHVINLSTGRTLYTDGGICGGFSTFAQAALNIYHDPNATGARSVFGNTGYREGMRLQAGDTLIIIVEGYSAQTGPFVLQVQEYRYNPSNAPSLPQPPFFSNDTSRVCWRGGFVRDTLNTGITNPALRHIWYVNGQPQMGVDGPLFMPQFNAPGINTILVEIRAANLSYCAPPTLIPRDTIYVIVDSLPDVVILVNGSPYSYPDFPYPEIEGEDTVCVQYVPSPVQSSYSYEWNIQGNLYQTPGPHTVCYTSSDTADTVVLVTRNGDCLKIDTLFVTINIRPAPVDTTDTTVNSLDWSRFIHIFPNPTRHSVYISSSLPGRAEIRLYDLTKRLLIYEEMDIEPKPRFPLLLPPLPEGLYILEVRQGEKVLHHRLLIQ